MHAGTICGPLHEVNFQAVHAQPQIGSLNLCYQKYLWCLYQQQDGETALTFACKKEDPRSVELLLKASADPNHTTMVSTVGKQSLLQLINFVIFNFKQQLNHVFAVAIYQEQKVISYLTFSHQLCVPSGKLSYQVGGNIPMTFVLASVRSNIFHNTNCQPHSYMNVL